MECPDARLLLAFRRPGGGSELAPEDAAALDRHLAGCPACAAAARRQDAFDAAVFRSMNAVTAPAGLRDTLLAQVLARRGAMWRRTVAKSAAIAAAVVLAVGITTGGLVSAFRPAFDTNQAADAFALEREAPEQTVRDWLAAEGLPPGLPYDFEYRHHQSHGKQVVDGREVPYVEFAVPSQQADRLDTARVLIVREGRFRLDADKLKPAQNSFATVLVVRDEPRRLAYVVIFTTPTLDPFLKVNARQTVRAARPAGGAPDA